MNDPNEAIDELLDHARSLEARGEHRYDNENLDDSRLRPKLRKVAVSRTLTLVDLDHAIASVNSEILESMRRGHYFRQRCIEKREDLIVFYVINTADNRLTVLARDAKCARFFAHEKGHIQDVRNGRVRVMLPENEAELRKSGKALGRALRDGHPGVATHVGENVVIERSGKVYTPMTVIE